MRPHAPRTLRVQLAGVPPPPLFYAALQWCEFSHGEGGRPSRSGDSPMGFPMLSPPAGSNPVLNFPQVPACKATLGPGGSHPRPQGEGRGPPLFGGVSWGPQGSPNAHIGRSSSVSTSCGRRPAGETVRFRVPTPSGRRTAGNPILRFPNEDPARKATLGPERFAPSSAR